MENLHVCELPPRRGRRQANGTTLVRPVDALERLFYRYSERKPVHLATMDTHRALNQGAETLEVIDKGHSTPEHPIPLLFVHGAFHGAWCWDVHFLDWFAEHGYRAIAVSLRGHGTSSLSTSIKTCSIADYVADVTTAVDRLSTPPIMVGHSMGGFIVQKYLEVRRAPAGVLVASAPPVGQHRTLLRLNGAHPVRAMRALVTARPLAVFDSPERVRKNFFSAYTPEDVVIDTFQRLQDDSPRAIVADMALLDLVRTKAITTPLLVIGADHDAVHPPRQIHDTARAYATTAHIIARAGHDLMLETAWPIAAHTILDWLSERNL